MEQGTSRGHSQRQGNRLWSMGGAGGEPESGVEGGERGAFPPQSVTDTGPAPLCGSVSTVDRCICVVDRTRRCSIEEWDFRAERSSGLILCSPRF